MCTCRSVQPAMQVRSLRSMVRASGNAAWPARTSATLPARTTTVCGPSMRPLRLSNSLPQWRVLALAGTLAEAAAGEAASRVTAIRQGRSMVVLRGGGRMVPCVAAHGALR